MKILVLYQYFGTPKGSWSTRIYELTKRWVNEGHQVRVITSPYGKSDIRATKYIEKQNIEGIDLTVINSADDNKMSMLKRAWRALAFSITATWVCLFEKADVVIASSGPITIGVPGLIRKWLRRTPFIFEVRDLWPGGAIEMKLLTNPTMIKIALYFEKLCYRNAKLVVAASLGQERDILRRYPDLKTMVIPNASDVDLFGKADPSFQLPDWAVNKKIFVHIGSLGFIHNCMQIIEAGKVLKDINGGKDYVIVFIGDGAEREALESRAKHYGLDFVYFLSLRPKTELVGWLHNSKATLFTTLNNPVQDASSPNKIFDSFAAGKAIIQTTNGWIKDLVAEEGCGINVGFDKADEMANAMIALATDDALNARLGENARRLSLTLFNRDILAVKYLNGIKSSLA